jgi:SAM-dependent MidA family methyltransferase
MPLDLDPGAAGSGDPRLVQAIVDEMAGGAIPFERFMEFALYHPEHGYYRKPGRIGKHGDFLTSPTVHPMFGWAIAAWCRDVWKRLGEPEPFTIFEPGAGDGALARAILDWADGHGDAFRASIRYLALEPNAAGTDSRVEWVTAPPEPFEGVVLSNELFDALPVRLFDVGGRGPVEVFIRWDGEQFVETPGGVAHIDGAPTAGRFEVNQRAFPLMGELCELVLRGAVLTFDYGYAQEELWAPWRTTGTLLCFFRHTAHENPYIHVGEQDMTTHVNFSDLATAAEDEGFVVHGPVSQSDFLYALGLPQLVQNARSDMTEYFARRRAMESLTDGAGLGRIRVMACTTALPGVPEGFGAAP